MAIVNRVPFNRRTRFILTASLAIGYGATLVPTWFANVFTYQGNNHALRGFYDAIVLVMETGFAVTAFISMILNLVLPEELEDTPEEVEPDLAHHKRAETPSSIGEPSKAQDIPSKEIV